VAAPVLFSSGMQLYERVLQGRHPSGSSAAEIVPNIDDIAAAVPDALAELVKAAQDR
jgi:hypothetical protein